MECPKIEKLGAGAKDAHGGHVRPKGGCGKTFYVYVFSLEE